MRLMIRLSICVLAVITAGIARAEAPVDVSKAVPVDVLTAEAKAKVAELNELLMDEKTYEETEKNTISQVTGTIACLAQAIAEHADGKESGIAAPALRDAALKMRKPKSFADSKSAARDIEAAMLGRGGGEKDYAWNKLINMHRMMEEMNARNSKIRRVIRRPSDPVTDSGHAATLTVLGIAMLADTHEVKNDADLPEWKSMSTDFTSNMSALAKAIRDGDKDKATELYTKGTKSCGACHKKFRD